MDYAVIMAAALLAAVLTFFSGFGLGSLLLPAMAVFYPLEVAIAATAVVHLANNVFKLVLVGRDIHWRTAWRFGIPAAAAALSGAWLLRVVSAMPPLHSYSIGERTFEITIVKIGVAALIATFAALECSSRFQRWSVPARWMPVGGLLSGFVGGLSGHQGPLRAAFMLRAGLSKEQFIATGAAAAVMVDVSRLFVYGATFLSGAWEPLHERGGPGVVAAACAAAFAGSIIGARLIRKVTMDLVRRIVSIMLMTAAAAMASGLM